MEHYVHVDPEIAKRIAELKLDETLTRPQPEVLIGMPNTHSDVATHVDHITDEFTSLCPLHRQQPDHAKIVIYFEPNDILVELKSLKLYLTSFRSVSIFHEDVPAEILKSLVRLIKPKVMDVTGKFTVRGGLKTEVLAVYRSGIHTHLLEE